MAAGEHDAGYTLQEEIELLEAIYINELTLKGPRERPSSVSLLLHPSTGDEGHKQYVCLTLVISLSNKYPNTLPSIQINNPRGLSDAHVESILSNLRELAESNLGSPMLFELIEYAKESLTDNNIPSCTCAICLSHFQDSHCFTKTECYHYFHCSCLAKYIKYSLSNIDENGDDDSKQIVCPMCRLPITYDLQDLTAAPIHEYSDDEVNYVPDKKMKELQKGMSKLFKQQFKKGGIIDIEQERNMFLIEIKKTPEPQNAEGIRSSSDVANETGHSGKPTSSSNIMDSKGIQHRTQHDAPQRERPPYARQNRGHGGQRYRNDGCWNWGLRSDRPKSAETTDKGSPLGARAKTHRTNSPKTENMVRNEERHKRSSRRGSEGQTTGSDRHAVSRRNTSSAACRGGYGCQGDTSSRTPRESKSKLSDRTREESKTGDKIDTKVQKDNQDQKITSLNLVSKDKNELRDELVSKTKYSSSCDKRRRNKCRAGDKLVKEEGDSKASQRETLSQKRAACGTNKESTLPSKSLKDDYTSSNVVKPPPGLSKIACDSGGCGPIGPPPGFQSSPPPPPPGF